LKQTIRDFVSADTIWKQELSPISKEKSANRLLGEILRRFPDNVVTVTSTENDSVHIVCGDTSFDIMGSSNEDYPELPCVQDGKNFVITQGNLRSMISQVIFAVSNNESRPIHTGALFEINEKEFQFKSGVMSEETALGAILVKIFS